MKKFKDKKKLHGFVRKAICLMMTFFIAIGQTAFAYAGSNEGVKWHRVRGESELTAAFPADPNGGGYNVNHGYTRVLITWDDKYFFTGSTASNGSWIGTRILATYGMDPTKDEFTCRYSYNTPYMRYHGWDGEHSGSEYTVRAGTESGLGSVICCINMKHFGVQWHCACEGSIVAGSSDNINTGKDDSGACCSATVDCDFTIYRWDGNGQCEFTFNTHHSGVHDRSWAHSGNCIYATKDEGGGKNKFKIFYGEAVAISVIGADYTISENETFRLNNYTVSAGAQITVPKGSTFVLDGTNYNNGRILVDGGTLVILGLLDNDPSQASGTYTNPSDPNKSETYRPGDIVARNGGCIIVADTGVLLQRNAGAAFTLEAGTSAFVDGVMCISQRLTLGYGSTLRALPGSFIAVGVTPDGTKGCEQYTSENMKSYTNNYLSDVFSSAGTGLIDLSAGNASLIGYGGFFVNGSSTLGNNSVIEGRLSTNINASFGSMVYKW